MRLRGCPALPILFATSLLAWRPAAGQPLEILCEAHGGPRPPQADAAMAALREGLGTAPFIAGAELDALIADRLSRPAGAPDFPVGALVKAAVAETREDVIRGRFGAAVGRMEKLRTMLADQSAAIIANPHVRRPLHAGLLAMLKALLRLQRETEARALALEILRSFGDFTVTEHEFGPEIATFVGAVRAELRRGPTHALAVETTPSGLAVFLNERYVGMSPLQVAGLVPGLYRVVAKPPSGLGRAHPVAVGEDTWVVHIDVAFDDSLAAYGLRFADAADRARHEPAAATRLGRALGSGSVIAAGAGGTPERPLWIATRYDVGRGEPLRSAAVPLTAPRALLVALGRFLRTGETAAGLAREPERPAPTPPPATTRSTPVSAPASAAPPARALPPRAADPPPPRRRTTAGVITGSVAVVALVAGGLAGYHAVDLGRRVDSECKTGCTSTAVSHNNDAYHFAWIANASIGVGLVAAGVATYLLLARVAPERRPRAASVVAPLVARGGGGFGLGGEW